ncbi:MAG: MarR family transcriptional regulator [Bacteroidota bacterium]|nr:MarR family transcriptional regulator [Bacteroidota bacterium]
MKKIEEEIQQTKFGTSHEKAIINIIFTANYIQDKFKSEFKKFDITLPQYNVLRILKGKKGEHATCGLIKNVMLDKNPDVTRLCDKLYEKQYIHRNLNPDNRREVLLSISNNGLKLIDEISPLFESIYQHLFEISENDMLQLSDHLDLVRDKIKQ